MKYRNVSNGVIAAGSTPVMAAAIHDDISGGASEFILDFGLKNPLWSRFSSIQNRKSKIDASRHDFGRPV
ncbi:MAG: hypothetical protein ACLQOO_14075 [Terriglobia bacterium]